MACSFQMAQPCIQSILKMNILDVLDWASRGVNGSLEDSEELCNIGLGIGLHPYMPYSYWDVWEVLSINL